ncbi:MAG: serine protease [Bryobacterales bacterium]|nr:serine protease [Bryobacterales bacterium]
MTSSFAELSGQLANVVEQAAPFVVSVAAHPRHAASGLQWQPGVVVTVEHPLRQANAAEVLLADGRTVMGKVAGRDATLGVAVLRVEDAAGAGVVTTSAPVRAGNLTVTVGRGRQGNVTASMGIVSSVARAFQTWQGGVVDPLVQLDYSLYPSANGGAVVDASGMVVGLATSGFTRYGASAIPAAVLERVVATVLEKGFVPRAFLGVGLRPVLLPRSMAEQLEGAPESALLLLSVEPGSAAARAGLQVGDILCALDGSPTREPEDVQNKLTPERIGAALAAVVLRGGQRLDVVLTVGEKEQ